MARKTMRGSGSLERIGEMMTALRVSRPMLVAGERLAAVFARRTGMALPCFSGYHANPDLADCEAGRALYLREGCDGLISLGGGSAMDTAKGIKALMLAEDAEQALALRFRDMPLPHIAVPATAGTGAEATQFAVLYRDHAKISLSHPCLLPEGVVLDASLLDTLPPYHRKSCALDALCQGIESYWAKGATEDSRVDAYLAITGVLANLKAYLAGDKRAAEEMLEAAYRSGRAIQVSRTTAAHAMSYRLTQLLGIAHGHACALTLPVLWARMEEDADCLPVLMELAARMGLGSERMGSRLLRGLLIDLELEVPKPSPEVLDELAASVNAERLSNHPQTLSQEQLRAVYEEAFTPLSENRRQMCLDLWRYYGRA